MTVRTKIERPSFREALGFWSKLGWISFGGTAAHIAIMHDALVEERKWISNGRFLHALSLCMMLPGPEAQQLAIYIGWKLHGKKGGVAAGALFVLPSMFVLLALSVVYVVFGKLPWISSMFQGLKPAVIALVLLALMKVAGRALRRPVHWVVGAAAFVCMFFLNVSLLWILLGAVVAGGVVGYLWPSLTRVGKDAQVEEEDERGYFINRYSGGTEPLRKGWDVLRLAVVCVLLWLVSLSLFYFFADDFPFWRGLGLFFTKTAFVTIGGSYTVIPYVAQIAVTKLHWLSRAQMMDGFALAETTPGPLIIVVGFVGFMAGYNHFHGSLWMGALGLVATTFYTFLPCFLFVFAGAPLVEKTQGKPAIEAVLGMITAVVVGAILDLTLYLGKGVVFPSGMIAWRSVDVISVVWVAVCLVLLKRFRLNAIFLIALSVAFGGMRWMVATHMHSGVFAFVRF